MPEKSERKGSAFARILFQKSLDLVDTRVEWNLYDDSYVDALRIVAAQRKRPELIELDRFIHDELPSLIKSRSPHYLQHSELAQIMKWKLTRGKNRPLQKLVESNTTKAVTDASSLAFRQIEENCSTEDIFDSIMTLRGVGVATASAVLAILAPEKFPFMADEVVESVTDDGREYTMKVYEKMKRSLIEKAKNLEWDAERVGRALWTCAIINSNRETPTTTTTSSRSGPSARKIFNDESSKSNDQSDQLNEEKEVDTLQDAPSAKRRKLNS